MIRRNSDNPDLFESLNEVELPAVAGGTALVYIFEGSFTRESLLSSITQVQQEIVQKQTYLAELQEKLAGADAL